MLTPFGRQTSVLITLLLLTSCAPTGPTAKDFEQAIEQQDQEAVRSAGGPWWGTASAGVLRLTFSLTEAPDGRLQGTGTMRELNVAEAIPITVSGTYRQPDLSLTFTGIVYEGREASATFAAAYTSAGGVAGPLRLAGEGDSRTLSFTAREGAAPSASLGGRLTDAVTGAAVAGATVSVQGRSVTSSPTGHYGFDPNLAEGLFPVTVVHPIYVEVVRRIDIFPYRMMDFRLQAK